jgi:hypothetical protein
LRNKVSFITFNYDVSLEYELYHSLKAIAQFSEGNVINKFFEEDRFIHVYGKIRRSGNDGSQLGGCRPRIHSSAIPALRRPSKSRSL